MKFKLFITMMMFSVSAQSQTYDDPYQALREFNQNKMQKEQMMLQERMQREQMELQEQQHRELINAINGRLNQNHYGFYSE